RRGSGARERAGANAVRSATAQRSRGGVPRGGALPRCAGARERGVGPNENAGDCLEPRTRAADAASARRGDRRLERLPADQRLGGVDGRGERDTSEIAVRIETKSCSASASARTLFGATSRTFSRESPRHPVRLFTSVFLRIRNAAEIRSINSSEAYCCRP